MLLVRLYRVEDKEVMVMDGSRDFMPETGAIRLLASRESGVGADRVIVYCGKQHKTGFRVFTADGSEKELTAEDSLLLSRQQADIEVRLTDTFVSRMRLADEEKLAAAC
ncbi:MAG: diaminopimelate epimerase [Selenomonas sp.]|uniref:diaminopimelate epimerase n=1 Tax=Selenomonas ruminantium TaxID=971 RepID=UPI001B1F3DE2|nr:diaminopimelate epimerase [Selenomonas ruminantium]MBO5650538.1 diaminopimelate epimerase [Selenomonas sp.]